MAAITPFVESPESPESLDVEQDDAPGLAGFGAIDTKALIEQSHAGLTRFVWNRWLIEDHLRTCKFWLEDTREGIVIRIDKPLPQNTRPWKLMSPGARADQFALFSVGNAKMATLSWDLPSGPPGVGGACPGAVAAQSVLPPAARAALLTPDRTHLKVIPPGATERVAFHEERTICAFCYAGEGNFDYTEIGAAMLARYWWTKDCMSSPAAKENWITVMTDGVLRSPFPLQECKYSGKMSRPVRVHSSGDFFAPSYAEAWMEVANRVNAIDSKFIFWAPTRTWASPNFPWPKILAQNTAKNFVVRPSAYHVGDHAPGELIAGSGKGSTSLITPPSPGQKSPSNFQRLFPEALQNGMPGPDNHDPRRDFDCVAAGSLVPIRGRGYLPVEQVVAGVLSGTRYETLTRDGWKQVVGARAVGKRETVVVSLRSGHTLRVTPEHNFAICSEEAWKEAGSLELSDVAVLGREDAGAAHETSSGSWNYNTGVLLGYAVGDAYFGDRNVIRFEVGARNKGDDLRKLDAIATTMFGRGGSFSEYVKTRPHSALIAAGESLVARLAWTGVVFAEFFSGYGYANGVGSPVRRAPHGSFKAPRSGILGFLSGLFSADGSVSVKRNGTGEVELSSTSPGLLLDVQQLFSLLGAHVTIGRARLRPPHKPLSRLVVKSGAGLSILKEAHLLNNGKRNALEAITIPVNRRHRNSRVLSVERDGVVVEVFDIEVADCHEFIANGVVVHNCPAYAGDAEGSCVSARCRVCWTMPERSVNYPFH